MTSIAFYHTLDEERPFVKQWAAQHGVHVECFEFELHEDTLTTAEGFDGISYKQRSAPSSDPDFYRRLGGIGIRQIAVRSAGVDTIDLKAAHTHGIRITNVPSYSPRAVAELTLAHVMRLIRQIPQFDERVRRNDFSAEGLISREISELTVGVIGVGRIGWEVVQIFQALGARVIGNDIVKRPELSETLAYVSKEELFAQADVISIHTYLDSTTRHLINADSFARMKPTSYFVNASRGPVVDTEALIVALASGQIAGAGIDVLEDEARLFGHEFPADATPNHSAYERLAAMPNVVITPHIGFFTDHAVRNMAQQSLDDALTIIRGGTSPHELAWKG